MSVETRRGCGFRKVGGLYLVGGGEGFACGRLPMPLTVCPVCSHGIKQSRGWTWVDAAHLLAAEPCGEYKKRAVPSPCDFGICPLSAERLAKLGPAGLLWIGGRFYPTTDHFRKEAGALGISRRIAHVPKGFKIGETWVLLAHPHAAPCVDCEGMGVRGFGGPKCEACDGKGRVPGVFYMFKPERVEKILTDSQRDTEEVEDLIKRGITPVYVPDDDRDHRGTVYDREGDDE